MLFTDAGCPGFGEADHDAGVTVAALRRRYPRLVIWGNVSSQFLIRATPQQVRDYAKRLIADAGAWATSRPVQTRLSKARRRETSRRCSLFARDTSVATATAY